MDGKKLTNTSSHFMDVKGGKPSVFIEKAIPLFSFVFHTENSYTLLENPKYIVVKKTLTTS